MNLKSNPSVSVIIPTYNGEKFVEEALKSIHAQTVPVDEILVVDDGSTDRTESLVKKFEKVRYFSQQHTGMPTAGRNRGLKESRSDFVAFLDQDDWWPENKLESQLNKMFLNEKPDIVMGKTKIINTESADDRLNLEKRFGDDHIFLLSAALFRKSAFGRVGLFDESFRLFGTDTDWFVRAREKGLVFYLQKTVTLYWRRHANNQLNDLPSWRETFIEIMKSSIKRRFSKDNKTMDKLPEFRILKEKP